MRFNFDVQKALIPVIEMEVKTLALLITKTIFVIIVMLLSIIGNSLVLAVVRRNPRLRTITNAYVINLAIADILMALFCMPLTVISLITVQWSLGEFMCKFQAILGVSMSFLSLQIMTLMAVNRYFRIVHPRKFPSIFTKRSTIVMICTIWIFGLCFGEIYVWAGGGEIAYITKAGTCFPRFIPLAVAIIGYVVPSGLMVLCYFLVYRAVRKHSMTVTCSLQRGNLHSAGPSCEELRTTKILFVVMLGFILCWVPTQVIGILLGKLMKTLPPEYPTICFTLIYLSSAINPIIYGVMNHKFRKEFKNLLLSLKDGVARMCPISLRRWFKTSTENHGHQEVLVLRAICVSPLPTPGQLQSTDGQLSKNSIWRRFRNKQYKMQETVAWCLWWKLIMTHFYQLL